MNIVPLNYKGEAIRFNTDGWINATSYYGKHIIFAPPENVTRR